MLIGREEHSGKRLHLHEHIINHTAHFSAIVATKKCNEGNAIEPAERVI